MRLIDADKVKFKFPYGFDNNGILMIPYHSCKCSLDNSPTVDAVPVTALLKLRDDLYENDQITMRGLKKLNQLISEYDSQREEGKDGR